MTAPIFLAVFLGFVLARVACWAFVQTIWLPMTHRRGVAQASAPLTDLKPGLLREQDEIEEAEQWLRRAALNIPDVSDPRYFDAVARLSVSAVEYRRSFGEALDRHFKDTDASEAFISAPKDALDQSTRYVLYAFDATLYDNEAARRNRLSAAISAGIEASCQNRTLSRSHRAALEEYASGAWRPEQDNPDPSVVAAVRSLIAAVDAIQGPGKSKRSDGKHV